MPISRSSYEIFEERLRHSIKGLSPNNRNDLFKAAYWDHRTNQYSKHILDKLDSIREPSSGWISELSSESNDFLIKSRRDYIQRRWDVRNRTKRSKERYERLGKRAEQVIRQAERDVKRREQRVESQKQKYINAKRKHTVITEKQQKPKTPKTNNLSQQTERIKRKRAGRDHLEPNRVVNKRSNVSAKLFEGKNAAKTFSKLTSNKWLRRGALGIAAMFAWSKVSSIITGANDRRAIPEHYDKGYDIISENLTDFGSPVNLWKTAAKTITPYKSSTRRGLRTSVRQILESNPALDLAANAIKHQQY